MIFSNYGKINQGMLSDLINTGLNWQESIGINPAVIKVIRSQDGIWEVLIRTGDSDYNKAGEGMDEELFNIAHFGIYYEYSAKQDCKLWLDDILISGVFIKDTIPPVLTDLKVKGSNTLLLTFSEPLDTFYGISPANFFAGEYIGYPAEISIEAPDILSLIFEKDFPAGTLLLFI